MPNRACLGPAGDSTSLPEKSHECRYVGVPKGIRTPVPTVKGSCPRPLDDGDCGRSEFVLVSSGGHRGGGKLHCSSLQIKPLRYILAFAPRNVPCRNGDCRSDVARGQSAEHLTARST